MKQEDPSSGNPSSGNPGGGAPDGEPRTERLWTLVHEHLDQARDPLADPSVLALLGEVDPAEATRVVALLEVLPTGPRPAHRSPETNGHRAPTPTARRDRLLPLAAAAGLLLTGLLLTGVVLRTLLAPTEPDRVPCVHWQVRVSTVAPSPEASSTRTLGAGRAPRAAQLAGPTPGTAASAAGAPPADHNSSGRPPTATGPLQLRSWTVRVGNREQQLTLPESNR